MSPKKTKTSAAQTIVGSPPTAKSPIEFKKVEEFSELYANNVKFESSAWDLKLIFGQTDQSLGPNVIVQHTAVTLPWPQVKFLIFGLSIALTEHEGRNGRIPLMRGLLGEIPEEMPQVVRDEGNVSDKTWKALREIYEDFIAVNPDAAPK
jgi:hypothetical protein